MTGEQAERLKRRFRENGTEWRQIDERVDLTRFIMMAKLEKPYAHVHPGETAFTFADGLIVETGAIILSGSRPGARRAAYLAETHFALISENAVFETLGDFLSLTRPPWHKLCGPALTLICGPSRTADIEKTLVMGAHGPRRLIVGTAPPELIKEMLDEGRA